MKNFREAVKREMEREGWKVEHVKIDPVNLKSERNDQVKLICAWKNGHGHIYRETMKDLRKVQKLAGIPVLVAKVNGANEIIFLRLEKFLSSQKEEKKTSEFIFKEPRELGFVAHQDGKFIKGGRK